MPALKPGGTERQAKPAARLYLGMALAAGATVPLNAGQAHYLKSVLRLTSGRQVLLFNGQDGEWLAELAELGKTRAAASVLKRTRGQTPEPDLWLLFAPIKGDRIDTVAEKATELGVARLQPVMTRRTVVSRVNIDRLRARAIEAAEQCARLSVPEVSQPRPLREILIDWPGERRLFACAEAGPARPLAEVLYEDRLRRGV